METIKKIKSLFQISEEDKMLINARKGIYPRPKNPEIRPIGAMPLENVNKEIVIEIPFKTESINHLYGFRGFRKFIKPEGKRIRKEIYNLIKKQNVDVSPFINKKLKLKVEIYENWFTKKGDIYRKDVSNREKFQVDSIFNALGLDDKQIFHHTMIKKQSEDEEKSIVRIKIL